jgi:hypothetical protein
MAATLAPPRPAPGLPSFEQTLALALRLAHAAPGAALALDLEPIDLPPALGGDVDRAALVAAAPLYLAAELESARLLPSAEVLAGLFMSGGWPAQLADADVALLTAFWRERHRRFSAEERDAFFARMFGRASRARLALPDASNGAFEGLLLDLAEALFNFDPPAGLRAPPASPALLLGAVARLAENLAGRGRGVPAAAAAELVGAVNSALAIFKAPAVQAALGARGVWSAVRSAAHRYLDEDVDVGAHVERGRSGVLMLAWLAEAAPAVGSGGAPAAPAPEVVAAAGAWLRTTLALLDRP